VILEGALAEGRAGQLNVARCAFEYLYCPPSRRTAALPSIEMRTLALKVRPLGLEIVCARGHTRMNAGARNGTARPKHWRVCAQMRPDVTGC
jgi:hypothetical protein